MRRQRESNGFPYRAQVLDRFFAILDDLAARTEDLSLGDMGEKLNLHTRLGNLPTIASGRVTDLQICLRRKPLLLIHTYEDRGGERIYSGVR